MYDAIVVGSGPGGANAAAALVERGRRVLMLDVGEVETHYASLVPPQPFHALRAGDVAQHRYFLGDAFEGVSYRGTQLGAQLTPPRRYIFADSAMHTPLTSSTLRIAESLTLGGLGNGWGAGVTAFSAEELAEWPVDRPALQPHYDAVARRIGISAPESDDLTPFLGPVQGVQPPLDLDSNAERLLARYQRKRAALNGRGFFLGRPPLAVSTTAHHGRGPHAYRDMEFWADTDRSVYRSRYTIEELRRSERFTYAGQQLVLQFEEPPGAEGAVEVTARHTVTGEVARFQARSLLLGAGTLGTARIVLRSLQRYDTRVPFLCNPYTYVPVVHVAMLGRAVRDRRHSLAQLCAFYRPSTAEAAPHDLVEGVFFSYRSLLTYKLMQEAPIAYREGLRLMQLLTPAFGIVGIHHMDRPSSQKYVALRRGSDGGTEVLDAQYRLSAEETSLMNRRESELLRGFVALGCVPIKKIRPGHGSSIHYAGTFPMSARPGELQCDADCRLHGTRAVHLVDGSSFPTLPAKGLTFTIMANADRVATRVAERLA